MDPVNVFYKSSSIYCEEVVKHNLKEKEKLLGTKLIDLFDDEQYVDLVINFMMDETIIENVPLVRVNLK